jgi:hypothetical protein
MLHSMGAALLIKLSSYQAIKLSRLARVILAYQQNGKTEVAPYDLQYSTTHHTPLSTKLVSLVLTFQPIKANCRFADAGSEARTYSNINNFSPSSTPSPKATMFISSQETRGHLILVDAWIEVAQNHAVSRRDTSDQTQSNRV